MHVYHVTTAEAAKDILRHGFLGGWGDIGFGVYFYGSLREASAYAQKGGWDKTLSGEHVVVLRVRDPDIRRIHPYEMDPSWDARLYDDMWFLPGMEDDEDAYIVPEHVEIAQDYGVIPRR